MFKILVGVVCAVLVFFAVQYVLTERGSVTGDFVKGGHKCFGDSCGEYPSSFVRLVNWSKDSNIYESDVNNKLASFHFGNQFEGIDNCAVGQKYKFSFHKESRSADAGGDDIEYWVLDSIEPLT